MLFHFYFIHNDHHHNDRKSECFFLFFTYYESNSEQLRSLFKDFFIFVFVSLHCYCLTYALKSLKLPKSRGQTKGVNQRHCYVYKF